MINPSRQDEALEPLRAELLVRARAAADENRVQAQAEADAALRVSATQAADVVAAARAEGTRAAAATLAAERSAARARGRALVLGAQCDVHQQLRDAAVVAVRALLREPGQLDHLAAVIRARLGDPVELRDVPGGGIAGLAATGARMTISAEALVDQALAAMDLEGLWSTPQ